LPDGQQHSTRTHGLKVAHVDIVGLKRACIKYKLSPGIDAHHIAVLARPMKTLGNFA